MEKTFTMYIGLPGSGKSTYGGATNSIIVSSDKIREELYGSESVQDSPDKVFKIAKERIWSYLKHGIDGKCGEVVLDATNISKKLRIAFLKELRSAIGRMPCRFKAVWFATPFDVCVERNKNRERVVPHNAMVKMYKNFAPPMYEEGFDEIEIVYSGDYSEYTVDGFFEKAMPFDQHNRHHTATVGEHCMLAKEYVEKNGGNTNTIIAAMLHDNGKLYTASFLNGKGEETDEMHFYQHHCVGAYDLPFYIKNCNEYSSLGVGDIVYISNLIYYHMHPLNNWKNSDKALLKDRMYMGEQFYNDLVLLNRGDVNAH